MLGGWVCDAERTGWRMGRWVWRCDDAVPSYEYHEVCCLSGLHY